MDNQLINLISILDAGAKKITPTENIKNYIDKLKCLHDNSDDIIKTSYNTKDTNYIAIKESLIKKITILKGK